MPTRKELKNKKWHRIAKVFNYFLVGLPSAFILYSFINNEETILLSIITALTVASALHLILSIIYYRIILYIIYGEEGYIYHWPFKKIIFFTLIVVAFSGITKFLSYQQPNSERMFSFLESDQLMFDKDIEVEVLNAKDKGSEVSIDESEYIDLGGSSVTTEGRFIEVEIALKNIKKETVSLSWDVGKLTDSEGRTYKPYGNSKESFFSNYQKQEIAPGFSDRKKILYEVPTDSELETVKIKSFDFQNKAVKLN